MPDPVMRSPQSAVAANSGDLNGGVPPGIKPVDKSVLASLLGRMQQPADSNNANAPAQTPEQSGPAATSAVPADDDAAGSDLPPENPGNEAANETAELPPETAEGSDVLSQPLNDTSGEAAGAVVDDADADRAERVRKLAELMDAEGLEIGQVKRIDKLVKEKRDLERRLAEAEAKPSPKSEVQSPTSTPLQISNNPYAGIADQAELERTRAEIRKHRNWALRNPDGGVLNGVDVSREQAIELRIQADDALEEHLPKVEKMLNERAKAAESRSQTASYMRQKFPQFYDLENELAQRTQFFLGLPELRNHAQADLIAAQLALGERELKKLTQPRPASPKSNVQSPKSGSGKVPLGKPSAGGGGGPQAGAAKTAGAIQRLNTERSKPALAGLLSAMRPAGK